MMLEPKTSLAERARIAWRVFRRGFPLSPWAKQRPRIAWPDFRQEEPQWQMVNYGSYAEEGFAANSVIYSAIMFKVRSISQAPLRAYTGDLEHPELLPPSHPMQALVSRPNRHQSWAEFQGLQQIYFNLAGDSYGLVIRERASDPPEAMYSLRPDRVWIIPGKSLEEGIKGYLYVPEGKSKRDGVPILPQDMVHVKLPNPLDPLEGMGYGLSAVSPGAHSADVDNYATRFLRLFWERGTMLTGLLSFNAELDDPTIAGIRERWKEIYGGYENWAEEIGVLGKEGKYQRIGMTFAEMEFDSLDERNEARILGPFGVPPILIGTRLGLARSTFSNYQEARKACWEDTLVPELRWFEVDYQHYLRTDDAWVAFDLSRVPALQKDVPKLVDAAYRLWQMGTPANQATEAVGLSVGDIPGGDIGYLPYSVVPRGIHEGDGGQQDDTGDEDDRKRVDWLRTAGLLTNGRVRGSMKVRGLSADQKAAHWKAIDLIAQSWEEKFGEAANAQFKADQRAILALVNEAKGKALHRKQTIEWAELLPAVELYLAMESKANWRAAFVPLLRGVIADQGERWSAELGMEWDVENVFAQRWFDDYVLEFAQPIGDTTKKQITSVLQQAQREGWTVGEMEDRLGKVFQQWTEGDLTPEDFQWFEDRMPQHRREMIARTETIRASNAGSHALYDEWEVQQREWLATQDDRVRETHSAASGQVVAKGEPYTVGGYPMMYPGDASLGAPPEEYINCRCTELPVINLEGIE